MKHAWQRRSEKGYHFSRISFTTNLISVLLMGIASVCYQFRDLAEGAANRPPIAVVFLILTAVLDVVHIPFLWFCLPSYRKSYVPVNSNLASERFGLIYIVSLGELVLSAVSMTLHTRDEMAHVVRVTAIMLLGVLTGLLFQSSFFGLYDLQADHAKKHTLEVSVLRQWAILHVTSLLALLASLVAAIFARLSLGIFTPTDRLTLWLTFAFKILLFSGSNLLYLRHVRVAYGWVADLMAVFLLMMLGMVLPPLVNLGDVVFVGLAIGIWALLAFVRGVVLPVRLTAAGEEELHALSRKRQWKRRFTKLPFLVVRRANGGSGGGGDKEGGAAAGGGGGGGRGRERGGNAERGRGRGGRGGRRKW
jgi:low temperature requirement protein LtrA